MGCSKPHLSKLDLVLLGPPEPLDLFCLVVSLKLMLCRMGLDFWVELTALGWAGLSYDLTSRQNYAGTETTGTVSVVVGQKTLDLARLGRLKHIWARIVSARRS